MNLKALIEKRNALIADMKSLCDKATAETRAMTTEEQTDYDAKKSEVEALNKTIRSIEEQNALNLNSERLTAQQPTRSRRKQELSRIICVQAR